MSYAHPTTYHSKANCEATQELGVLGEEAAQKLSDLKEKFDQYTYIHTHKVTIEEAIADSERDQIANRLGRERGRKYPDCKCSELMQDLLPQKYNRRKGAKSEISEEEAFGSLYWNYIAILQNPIKNGGYAI